MCAAMTDLVLHQVKHEACLFQGKLLGAEKVAIAIAVLCCVCHACVSVSVSVCLC